jgi:hypothetical protein
MLSDRNDPADSINAVCAGDGVCAVTKKGLQRDVSLYTSIQVPSGSIFEETQISCALQQPLSQSNVTCRSNRLILCDIKPDSCDHVPLSPPLSPLQCTGLSRRSLSTKLPKLSSAGMSRSAKPSRGV